MGRGLRVLSITMWAAAAMLTSQNAAANDTWAISVNGPGPSTLHGSVAAGVLALQGPHLGPGGTLGLAVGVNEVLDFRADVNLAAALGSNRPLATGTIEPHVLVRPLGKRIAQGNIGLKVGPEILFAGGRNRESAVFGITHGLAVSMGTSAFQFTTGLDFPIYLAAAGDLKNAKVTPALRVALTLEWALGERTSLYSKWAPVMSYDQEFLFFTHTVGVTF